MFVNSPHLRDWLPSEHRPELFFHFTATGGHSNSKNRKHISEYYKWIMWLFDYQWSQSKNDQHPLVGELESQFQADMLHCGIKQTLSMLYLLLCYSAAPDIFKLLIVICSPSLLWVSACLLLSSPISPLELSLQGLCLQSHILVVKYTHTSIINPFEHIKSIHIQLADCNESLDKSVIPEFKKLD